MSKGPLYKAQIYPDITTSSTIWSIFNQTNLDCGFNHMFNIYPKGKYITPATGGLLLTVTYELGI